MKDILISVIIPTRNRANYLSVVLESILKQDLPINTFEVIVVDNGSTDNTKQVCESFSSALSNLKYVFVPQPGLHIGRHAGFEAAKSDLLVYADDDIRASSSWLSSIFESFNDPHVHLVGGRYLPDYEVDPPEWLKAFWRKHEFGRICGCLSLLDFGEQVLEIDPRFVWGLSFAIRKESLLKFGGFHPDSFPWELRRYRGDGETSISLKMKDAGLKAIYNPGALVYHKVTKERMTIEHFERRAFLQGISDSYTLIRRDSELETENHSNNKKYRGRKIIRKFKKKMKQFIVPESSLKSKDPFIEIKKRVRLSYHQGYQFHKEEVRRDPNLLKWVLKNDYWDCQLPIGPS